MPNRLEYVWQCVFAGLFGVVLCVVMNAEGDSWVKAQWWIRYALSTQTHTETMQQTYAGVFGTRPAFLPSRFTTPTDDATQTKLKTLSFFSPHTTISAIHQTNGLTKGIYIQNPYPRAPIQAYKEGLVVYAGECPVRKYCVVLLHNQKTLTVYGMLAEVRVATHTWIDKDHVLGTPAPQHNAWYFAVIQQGRWVDPWQAIAR
jgi:hypothetical protein